MTWRPETLQSGLWDWARTRNKGARSAPLFLFIDGHLRTTQTRAVDASLCLDGLILPSALATGLRVVPR